MDVIQGVCGGGGGFWIPVTQSQRTFWTVLVFHHKVLYEPTHTPILHTQKSKIKISTLGETLTVLGKFEIGQFKIVSPVFVHYPLKRRPEPTSAGISPAKGVPR